MNSLTITDRTLAKAWLSIINIILGKRRSQTPWTKHRNISTLQLPNSSTLRIWSTISTTGQSVLPKFFFLYSIEPDIADMALMKFQAISNNITLVEEVQRMTQLLLTPRMVTTLTTPIS